jgi:hypothetical protein
MLGIDPEGGEALSFRDFLLKIIKANLPLIWQQMAI